MFIGISVYFTLLWLVGRKIPGRLRKRKKSVDYISEGKKRRVIMIYNFILAMLIILGFLLIHGFTRGGL